MARKQTCINNANKHKQDTYWEKYEEIILQNNHYGHQEEPQSYVKNAIGQQNDNNNKSYNSNKNNNTDS